MVKGAGSGERENEQAADDLRARMKKWLETYGGVSETTAKDIAYAQPKVVATEFARREALQGLTIEDLATLAEEQKKFARRSNRQNWAIIGGTIIIIILTAAILLHW